MQAGTANVKKQRDMDKPAACCHCFYQLVDNSSP